jgi:hypothetical protein
LYADSNNILNRWKNYSCQLLNIHGVNDVKRTEMHTTEQLVPESSCSETEIATEKLKRYKSPGIDHVLVELIQTKSNSLHSGIHKNIIVPIYKKGDKTDCSNYRGLSLLPTTHKILSGILYSRLTPYVDKIIGDHQCGFLHNRATIDDIFCILQILGRNGSSVGQYIISLYT